jgi:hypothetical protein
MEEAGVHLLGLVRQGDPGLHPVHRPALGLLQRIGAFGMDDALAGRHPVDLARTNGLGEAQVVAVHDLALEQIGQGRQADVRVGTDVDRFRARRELRRTHLVQKDEGPDHPPRMERQDAADLEPAEILAPRVDHHLDHVVSPLNPKLIARGG